VFISQIRRGTKGLKKQHIVKRAFEDGSSEDGILLRMNALRQITFNILNACQKYL
jgi:hypothetical protein